MRTFVLGATLAILGISAGPVFASAECALRLTTPIAKVTRDALASGQISEAELRELIDAREPANPLRFRTPGTRNSSLSRFYAVVIAKHVNESSWAEARTELQSLLSGHSEKNEAVKAANEATKLVVAPILERKRKIIRSDLLEWIDDGEVGPYFLNSGLSYWLEVGGLISGEDFTIRYDRDVRKMPAALTHDAQGRTILKRIEDGDPGIFSAAFWTNKFRYRLISMDLVTKRKVETVFDLDIFIDGEGCLLAAEGSGVDFLVQSKRIVALTKPSKTYAIPKDGSVRRGGIMPNGTPILMVIKRDEHNRSYVTLVTFVNGEWKEVNSEPFHCSGIGPPENSVFVLSDGRIAFACPDQNPEDLVFYPPFKAVALHAFFFEKCLPLCF